ncbi:MAG: hypothetical protein Fur0046_13150 [Cyanobacteria bacterium J069]|nr:MAG: hypothetical protein D6742_10405 [Cyanobacteria bacterium J069]
MFLTEPITALTDYAIALECLIFALLLAKQASRAEGCSAAALWAIAFGSTAVAAGLGGTLHGFISSLPMPWAASLWRTMLLAIGLASFAMLMGTSVGTQPHRGQGLLRLVALGKLAAYGLWAWRADYFIGAIADYLLSMLLVVLLLQRVIPQAAATRWILGGVFLAVAAALVQGMQLALQPWLTPNDLYHLVQMLSLYGFFRGATQLSRGTD